MSHSEYQQAHYLGPQQGKIAALAFTTASEENALSTVLNDTVTNKHITMIATVAVYFAFSDGSASALDETTLNTAGDDEQCVLLPANTYLRVVPTGTHISLKGSAAGNIRMWVSSP